MKTTHANHSAARKLGLTLIAITLLAASLPAAEIIVMATGTLNGGNDAPQLFKLGPAWNLAPFLLVFHFDDTKGQQQVTNCGSTIITGKGEASPATAVLTINGIAHEFGKGVNPSSQATRSVVSGCSDSSLRFSVAEGPEWQRQGVRLVIRPAKGVQSLTQDADWRAPLSTISMAEWSNESSFQIVHKFGFDGTGANFNVKQLIVVKK